MNILPFAPTELEISAVNDSSCNICSPVSKEKSMDIGLALQVALSTWEGIQNCRISRTQRPCASKSGLGMFKSGKFEHCLVLKNSRVHKLVSERWKQSQNEKNARVMTQILSISRANPWEDLTHHHWLVRAGDNGLDSMKYLLILIKAGHRPQTSGYICCDSCCPPVHWKQSRRATPILLRTATARPSERTSDSCSQISGQLQAICWMLEN